MPSNGPSKKLLKTPTMIIPESSGEVDNSIPVVNSAEENGGVQKKPTFTSLFNERISESSRKDHFAPVVTPTTATQVKSRWSFSSSTKRSFGSSRDETFFDSHQWLQSDSEDEFYSVNGDFSPSIGNTPKCSFSEKPPRLHTPLFEEGKLRISFSPSPAPRRKKLAELFRDSIREEREKILEETSENQTEMSKQSSGDNSDELKITADSEREKKNYESLNHHHHHRCLPRFSSFKGSSMEKKKKNKKKTHLT